MIFNEACDALRRLRRRPGYSLLSVGMLGVGLGLTLFVFNLVHALILAPLPYPHADRLVAIGEIRDASGGVGDVGVGIDELDGAQYQLLGHSLSGVERLGAYAPVGVALDAGGQVTRYEGGVFSASMMDLLGVRPLLGRGFNRADETPGATPVVLIGESLWRRAFGADAAIVGRAVRLDGGWATVVGVLPVSFGFPGNSVIWKPLVLHPGQHADLLGVARLKPGETAASLRAALAAQADALQRVLPAGSACAPRPACVRSPPATPFPARNWVATSTSPPSGKPSRPTDGRTRKWAPSARASSTCTTCGCWKAASSVSRTTHSMRRSPSSTRRWPSNSGPVAMRWASNWCCGPAGPRRRRCA